MYGNIGEETHNHELEGQGQGLVLRQDSPQGDQRFPDHTHAHEEGHRDAHDVEDDYGRLAAVGAAGSCGGPHLAGGVQGLVPAAAAALEQLEAVDGGLLGAARVAGREVGDGTVLRADGHEGGGRAQALAGAVGLLQLAPLHARNGAHVALDKDQAHEDGHQMDTEGYVDACDFAGRELGLRNDQATDEHSHRHHRRLEKVRNEGRPPLRRQAILLVVGQEEPALQKALLLQAIVHHRTLHTHDAQQVDHQQTVVEEPLQRWPEIGVVQVGGELAAKAPHVRLFDDPLGGLVDNRLGQPFGKQPQEQGSHEDEGSQYHPSEPPAHLGQTHCQDQKGARLLAKDAGGQGSCYHRRTVLREGVVVDVADPQCVVGQATHAQGQLEDEEHREGEAAALGLSQRELLELGQRGGAQIGIQQNVLRLVALGTSTNQWELGY